MKEAIEQYNFEPKLYTTTSFIINLNHEDNYFLYWGFSELICSLENHEVKSH